MPSISNRNLASQRSPLFLFGVLIALSIGLWFRPLISSFALAYRDSEYTHILLIIPVSLTLIFLDWKAPQELSKLSLIPGAILMSLAGAVTVAVRLGVVVLHPDERLSLNMAALVLWWIGAFIFCFGFPAFKGAVFPLCFLFWLVPIPQVILDPVVRLLQEGSAASADLIFAIAGVPVAREETIITIPGLVVEVARECSSIRSSLMLVVTTMVLAQMLLRSPWRKALVIAVAIPLSVVKNGLRIFVLGMLATRVDPSYLTGRLHHEGGIIYFLIALAAIFLCLWIARRGDGKLLVSP
ncbi:MAG: exosortase/archaeosortase family protein [Candidatus Sulfotelmatobacter sp.]